MKRSLLASFVLVPMALLWSVATLFVFRFSMPNPVEGDSRYPYWYGIDPITAERARELQIEAFVVLAIGLGIAAAHVIVAVLHARKPWGRWLTAVAGALYLAFALLCYAMLGDHVGRGDIVFIGGAVGLAAILLYSAFGRVRPSRGVAGA